MKDTSLVLTIVVYVVILGAVSVLVSDIAAFNNGQFQQFLDWAKSADPNEPWNSRQNLIQWNIVVVNVAEFALRAYLIYGFTYLISILNAVEKDEFFTDKVIGYFKKIGDVFISYVIGLVIIKTAGHYLEDSSFKLFNEFKSELTYMIPCALGFYLLAEIFRRAKAYKDENDLTV